MPKKKFNSNFEKIKFNLGDIDVLRELLIHEYGLNQENLNKKTDITIGGISKILGKLEKLGLLYNISGRIKIYRIVPERRKEVNLFIRAYEKGKGKNDLFSCHAFVIECPVNELPRRFLKKITEEEGWIEYAPKNWTGYKTAYLDATIKFHKTHKQCKVYFFFRTIAESPHIAETINIEKFLEKKVLLEAKYPGLKIGTQTILGSQNYCEISWLRDPISLMAIKLGLKHKCVEDSYKIGGEWEEKGINAIERINRIFEFRDLINELSNEQIKETTEFIKKLLSSGKN